MGEDSKFEPNGLDQGSERSLGMDTESQSQETQSNQSKDAEYPKKMQLTLIAVALALALFLIALDMVRYCSTHSPRPPPAHEDDQQLTVCLVCHPP